MELPDQEKLQSKATPVKKTLKGQQEMRAKMLRIQQLENEIAAAKKSRETIRNNEKPLKSTIESSMQETDLSNIKANSFGGYIVNKKHNRKPTLGEVRLAIEKALGKDCLDAVEKEIDILREQKRSGTTTRCRSSLRLFPIGDARHSAKTIKQIWNQERRDKMSEMMKKRHAERRAEHERLGLVKASKFKPETIIVSKGSERYVPSPHKDDDDEEEKGSSKKRKQKKPRRHKYMTGADAEIKDE